MSLAQRFASHVRKRLPVLAGMAAAWSCHTLSGTPLAEEDARSAKSVFGDELDTAPIREHYLPVDPSLQDLLPMSAFNAFHHIVYFKPPHRVRRNTRVHEISHSYHYQNFWRKPVRHCFNYEVKFDKSSAYDLFCTEGQSELAEKYDGYVLYPLMEEYAGKIPAPPPAGENVAMIKEVMERRFSAARETSGALERKLKDRKEKRRREARADFLEEGINAGAVRPLMPGEKTIAREFFGVNALSGDAVLHFTTELGEDTPYFTPREVVVVYSGYESRDYSREEDPHAFTHFLRCLALAVDDRPKDNPKCSHNTAGMTPHMPLGGFCTETRADIIADYGLAFVFSGAADPYARLTFAGEDTLLAVVERSHPGARRLRTAAVID